MLQSQKKIHAGKVNVKQIFCVLNTEESVKIKELKFPFTARKHTFIYLQVTLETTKIYKTDLVKALIDKA